MTCIRKSCINCGSTNIHFDAWAEWDEPAKQYLLSQTFEHCFCEDCETNSNDHKEEEIPQEPYESKLYFSDDLLGFIIRKMDGPNVQNINLRHYDKGLSATDLISAREMLLNEWNRRHPESTEPMEQHDRQPLPNDSSSNTTVNS